MRNGVMNSFILCLIVKMLNVFIYFCDSYIIFRLVYILFVLIDCIVNIKYVKKK